MTIVLLVFCALSIVGGWSMWRRSPLYSGKTTLKLAAIFLLMVAAIVGGTLAILKGPISHSPTAQAILAVIALVGISTGATGILIRTTDSHVAQLPLSVRLIAIQRHKVQRWIWRTLVYLLICAAAGLIVPSPWDAIPLGLGGLVLLLCGPMFIGFYMRARRLDLGMSEVMASPWAHWQYTPAQWECWARSELAWEQSKLTPIVWRRDWRKMAKAVFTMGAIFAGCSLFFDMSVKEKLWITAGGMGFMLAMMLCTNWINRASSRRNYRHLLAAPREAYFGNEGVYWNGEFSPWILSGSYLVEATAPRDPPAHLAIVFQTYTGNSSIPIAKRIPIPEGRESDVVLLQQQLRTRCPKAAVRLA